MVEDRDLVLELGENCEVIAPKERVSPVLQRREHLQRLLQAIGNLIGSSSGCSFANACLRTEKVLSTWR